MSACTGFETGNTSEVLCHSAPNLQTNTSVAVESRSTLIPKTSNKDNENWQLETTFTDIYNAKKSKLYTETMEDHEDTRSKTNHVTPTETAECEPWEAWIILCAVGIQNILFGILWISFGVYYIEFTEYFRISQARGGMIGSVMGAFHHICVIFVSGPIEIWGCRPVTRVGAVIACVGLVTSSFASNSNLLTVSFGVVTGTGLAVLNLPQMVIVQQYFVKNKAIATGVAFSGYSVGHIIGPIITDFLIEKYTWRGALLITSTFPLQSLVLAVVYKPPKKITRQARPKFTFKDYLKRTLDFSLVKHIPFLVFCIMFVLLYFNMRSFYTHLPSRTILLGYSRQQAALLLTIASIMNLISRLAGSLTVNNCFNRPDMVYCVCVFMTGLASLLVPFTVQYWSMVFATVLFGAGVGCIGPMANIIMVEMLGVNNIARSRAIFDVFSGVADLTSTPVSGLLYDTTQNYNIPFTLCGCFGVAASLGSLIVVLADKHRQKQKGQYISKVIVSCKSDGDNMEQIIPDSKCLEVNVLQKP